MIPNLFCLQTRHVLSGCRKFFPFLFSFHSSFFTSLHPFFLFLSSSFSLVLYILCWLYSFFYLYLLPLFFLFLLLIQFLTLSPFFSFFSFVSLFYPFFVFMMSKQLNDISYSSLIIATPKDFVRENVLLHSQSLE